MGRIIKLKYYEQSDDVSCGPACLRMVFGFFGKKFSEKKLNEELHTTSELGTSNKQLVKFARKLGFFCYEFSNSDIKKLKYFINKGLPVIVNYLDLFYNEGHFAVVIGYDSKNLVLNDPYNGRDIKIKFRDFVKRWHGGFQDKNVKRWMMLVSDKILDTAK